MKKPKRVLIISLLLIASSYHNMMAQEKEHDKVAIAKEIANPITTLTTVPFQFNFDFKVGPLDEGTRQTLNIQPLIPFKLSEDWNLITRTVIPIINQNDVLPGVGSQFGLGDIVQSFFFSPSHASPKGWSWGAGPVLSLPTGTDDLLGTGKLGLGPTFIGLQVAGPITYGLLLNHYWSVAGNSSRPDVTITYIQPFFDYTTEKAVTFELTTETFYDWESEQWTVPLILTANKVVTLGKQLAMIGGGLRYWTDDNMYNPKGLAFNISFYLLFPK